MTDQTKPFLAALQGKTHKHPPIWLMRQAGRYLEEYRAIRADVSGFLELCYTPELAIEVTMQPIRRFGFDAAILFSDILVLPDALGQNVTFVQGEGPKLEPVRSMADIQKLSANWIFQRLEPVYETVSGLSETLPKNTALIGFAGAPWTVATYMVEGGSSKDFATVKGWAFEKPDEFQVLIDLIVEGTAEYLSSQIENGAEAIQIFDSWAGVLPEDAFDRWVIAPTKKLISLIRAKHPETPIIGFPRGAGLHYPDYVRETGVTAVGLDTTMPTKWAADNLQNHLPVQGNLDPQVLLAGGKTLDDSVHRILENLSNGPFIFNLGHGIIKETPVSHVERLMDLVRGRV